MKSSTTCLSHCAAAPLLWPIVDQKKKKFYGRPQKMVFHFLYSPLLVVYPKLPIWQFVLGGVNYQTVWQFTPNYQFSSLHFLVVVGKPPIVWLVVWGKLPNHLVVYSPPHQKLPRFDQSFSDTGLGFASQRIFLWKTNHCLKNTYSSKTSSCRQKYW